MIPAGGMEKWLDDMDTFLGAAAQARSRENDGRADATKAGVDMAGFAERARFVGMEAVRGREAFLLRVDDVSGIPEQQMGDATFVIERGSLWIDKQYYVQLRLRMEGRMEAAGKPSVPIVIELEELDFVYIPPLYEPRRKVMRLTGLMGGMAMDPKQAQKLAKAQADMEKMKVQLAQLTPQQRAMVQGQVDKAEAMMAQMTGGNDVVETEVEYMVYSINKGPPFNWRPFCPSLEPDAPKFPTIPGGPATQPACGTL